MDATTLKTAIAEAERFLVKAKEALVCREEIKQGEEFNPYGDGYGPANAAARRSSLDLTRALAELRK